MQLFVGFLFFRQTVAKNNWTPGNRLQNLQYSALDGSLLSKAQKLLFLLLTVGLRYLVSKINAKSIQEQWGSRAQALRSRILAYKALKLIT